MPKRYQRRVQDGQAVMISLAVSIGTVVFALLGWWLWKIFEMP